MNLSTSPFGILVLALALLCPPATFAQDEAPREGPDLAGRWTGAIDALGQVLEIRLEFHRGAEGWSGTLSIPVQSLVEAPLAKIELEGRRVRFALPGVPGDARFEGELSEDGGRIEGPFLQHGLRMRWHATSAAADAESAAGQLDGFGEWLGAALEAWKVPGIAVACVKGGEVILLEARGLRDVEQGLAVTPDTLFAIGSCTKAFTALALGLLVAEGRAGWDDPVRATLPSFRLHERLDSGDVTLRDLVTHRTGLPRHDLVWYGRPSLERRALLERLPYLEPSARLRERWQYNNLMYVVAGLALEELAAASWEEVLRARLLAPLGMDRTVFSVADAQADPDHALPYRLDEGRALRIPFRRIEHVGPAGSIQSSARDMARWLELWLARGTVDGRQVVEPATLRAQLRSGMPLAGSDQEQDVLPLGYAHGWVLELYRGHLRISHGGGIDGFSAQVAFAPQAEVGVVVLANVAGGLPELVARHALDRLLGLETRDWSGEALARRAAAEATTDPDAAPAPPRRAGAAPPRPLAEYAGLYEHEGYGQVLIELEGEALRLRSEELSARLEPWHFEVFRFAPEPGSQLAGQHVQFLSDFEGEVEALRARVEPAVAPIHFARLADPRLEDPAHLARYVGRYSLSGVLVRVELRGSRLEVTVPGQPTYTLRPVREDHFELTELPGYRLHFEVRADGPATSATFLQPNGVFRAERAADGS